MPRCFPTPDSSSRTFSLHFSINQETSYCDPEIDFSTYITLKNSKKEASRYLMDLVAQNEIPLPNGVLETFHMSIDGIDFILIDDFSGNSDDPDFQSDINSGQSCSGENVISQTPINPQTCNVSINDTLEDPDDPSPQGQSTFHQPSRDVPQTSHRLSDDQRLLNALNSSSRTINKTKKNKTSSCWKFFIKTPEGGTCKLCLKSIASAKCTTNLIKHLERKHANVYNMTTQSQLDSHTPNASNNEKQLNLPPNKSLKISITNVQPQIDTTFQKISSFNAEGSKGKNITNAIVFMVVKDNLPFNTTENEGFISLLKTIAPLYKIPKRQSITSYVENKYEALKLIVKRKLTTMDSCTITSDVWTEIMSSRSFLSLTIHYRENQKLSSLFLDLQELNDHHTSENISKTFENILIDWDIPKNKILAIITDNGANMVKAARDTFGELKHLRCCAHLINLVIKDILDGSKLLDDITKKVRTIVLFFKAPLAASYLRKSQDAEECLRCVQDVTTRWNSTFYMFLRFLRIKSDIGAALLEMPNSPPMLSPQEIALITELVEILKPFESVTKILSGETYVTSSRVMLAIEYLKKSVALAPSSTELTKTVKKEFLKSINNRFNTLENHLIFGISTLLDPRFKRTYFQNIQSSTNAVTAVNKLLKKNIPSKESLVEESSNLDDIWKFHISTVNQLPEKTPSGPIDPDLKRFLDKEPEKNDINPLEYWIKEQSNSPVLSSIALKYLSTISTSVPSERMFSSASHVITDIRNRLSSTHLRQLLFLKSLDRSEWELE